MLMPVKLVSLTSKSTVRGACFNGLGGLISTDPQVFRHAISLVRIGRTFKTTECQRLPQLTSYLVSMSKYYGKVIDVGASDGSASLSFIEALDFDEYWITDKDINLVLTHAGKSFRLYDSVGALHMYQSERFLFYLDPFKMWQSPSEYIVTRLCSRYCDHDVGKKHDVICLSPDLEKSGKAYRGITYDCNDPWGEEKGDLVLVANLLNKFHNNAKLMAKFCTNIAGMVAPGGLLAIADNEGTERASIYTRRDTLEIVARLGGGSVSESYIKF